MATCRVLLADEDDGVRAQLAGYLAQAGMDVVEARDGEAAWQIFSDDSDFLDCRRLDTSTCHWSWMKTAGN